MIRVNLATKKQSASVTGGASSDRGGLFGFLTQGKDLDLTVIREVKNKLADLSVVVPFAKVALYLVLSAVAWFGSSYWKDLQIEAEDALIAQENTEKQRLTISVGRLKKFEEAKKALEEDEKILRTKIDAIRQLIAKRGEPIKALLALSQSIPEDVWLSDFQIRSNDIEMHGFATQFEKITDFIKNLGENDLFTDLVLKNTQMSKDSSSVSTPSFDVSLKLKER